MKHQFSHRVIYQDTDAEGVVYYANYLGLFERGRTELLRQMGVNLKELKEQRRIVFAVTRVECDYQAPALYDDELLVATEIKEKSAATVVFAQTASKAGRVLVAARVTVCALHSNGLRPTRLPAELK